MTWIETDVPRYMAARARPRYCIVSAGALLVRNVHLVGEWVPGFVEAWSSHLKQNDSDYHGNFAGALFERWFESLCATLTTSYGPCRVYMDGTSYHKRILNPAPTTSTKKQAILDWLFSEGIPNYNPELLTKKRLLSMVTQVRAPIRYSSVKAAKRHRHQVLYTLPYHPELQPIELVCGALKNRILVGPGSSIADVSEKIRAGLDAIDKHTWIGAYRKVQDIEKTNLESEQLEPPPPPLEEMPGAASADDFEEYEITL
ncbi:hypothetical protein PybrP1_010914 [[Pythium] brassicae (nom. inval.)]|nr:hypothetical protein PybrP1_010914 [[Pythium] brassicae (nom. inval.)]